LTNRTIKIAFSAVILAAAFGLAGTAANAESVMKVCGDQWKQAKANGTTNGMTWQQFLTQCRQQQGNNGAAATPAAAPAAAPAPAPAATTTAAATGGKTAKECNAEYAANKDAIKASGQKKKDFVEACRAGTENIPAAGAAPPPAPAPAAAPAPAPAAPAPAPAATAPAPKPATPKPTATSTGAGEFRTDAEAKAKCPTDTVVWVNTKTGVYHFAGTKSYGTTKQGAYMCEADAKAAGRRASEKEKHP
jgi:hypothetical protein